MEGFLDPNEILNQLNLEQNMIACDLGCGAGGWAIPLAKKINKGRVIAIDILKEPLSVLKNKASANRLFNIDAVLFDIEQGVKLQDFSLDLVLIANFLFEVEQKEKILREAMRILKPKGKLLIVDWRANSIMGPKEGRISLEQVKKMSQDIGFKIDREIDAGAFHWGIILVKE